MVSTARTLLVVAALTLVAGCATSQHDPTSPVSTDARASLTAGAASTSRDRWDAPVDWSGFYPLAIGRISHSVRTARFTFLLSDTSAPVVDETVTRLTRDVVGEVVFDGATYRDERTIWGGNDIPYVSSVLYRQTADGLFEYDGFIRAAAAPAAMAGGRTVVPLADAVGRELDAAWSRFAPRVPAARRAAVARAYAALRAHVVAMQAVYGERAGWHGVGPLLPPPPGELARLRYPLRVGAQWLVRQAPRFSCRVDGRETVSRLGLSSVPGWRIHYASELYGPNDVYHEWYGADGLLESSQHSEWTSTDESGNVVGTLILDVTEQQSAE